MTMWFEYDDGELYLYSNTDFEIEDDGTLKMQLTEESEKENSQGQTYTRTELTHAGSEARRVFNEVLAEMAPYS